MRFSWARLCSADATAVGACTMVVDVGAGADVDAATDADAEADVEATADGGVVIDAETYVVMDLGAATTTGLVGVGAGDAVDAGALVVVLDVGAMVEVGTTTVDADTEGNAAVDTVAFIDAEADSNASDAEVDDDADTGAGVGDHTCSILN